LDRLAEVNEKSRRHSNGGVRERALMKKQREAVVQDENATDRFVASWSEKSDKCVRFRWSCLLHGSVRAAFWRLRAMRTTAMSSSEPTSSPIDRALGLVNIAVCDKHV
jgi:hypothetical protein